jgi:alpha-D-ribose 1-methylphosphonate 5-triphosphate synthase subunit PhnI
MGYIAVRGGEEAILNAETLLRYQRLGKRSFPIGVEQLMEQLPAAVERIMGEGGLYSPEIAAAALKQAGGDTFEAAFLVRAHRSSVSRIGPSNVVDTEQMRVFRRISAAFKEIPGGQVLGATSDYSHRLIQFDLQENDGKARNSIVRAFEKLTLEAEPIPDTFPKVLHKLRTDGLLAAKGPSPAPPHDITLEPLAFPAPRSSRLQSLARAESGGLLALAYSAMRGYGQIHPVIGELRVGEVPVYHPTDDDTNSCFLGWVRVTECEVITQMEPDPVTAKPQFGLGYGFCFGHNEVKAISMAILDRTLQNEHSQNPSEDQEFVLLHTDGVEACGFCLHYKLPHYVTFQADLEQLRTCREEQP